MEDTMKTSLSNMQRSLLIRRAINMLIFSTIAVVLINPSQHSFAKQTSVKHQPTKQTSVQTLNAQKAIKQGFKDFCFFYYHDGKDAEEDQDTRVCQCQSS